MAEDTPPLICFNKQIVPWQEARIHVWSENAIRASNVFEGVRAYWDEAANGWNLVEWPKHFKRLTQSARIMQIPHAFTYDDFHTGLTDLLSQLSYHEHMYIRPTIYLESGRYGYRLEDVVPGMYIVAFPVPFPKGDTHVIRCCVSSWRRSDDLTSPPRAKAGASYQQFRLPRIEAAHQGLDDAILLNNRGTVAELTGAALFLVRENQVITPPFHAGILESITRAIVIRMLREEMDIEVIEREVERTELYISDEVFACGTLSEIASIVEVDHMVVGAGSPGALTSSIAKRYRDLVTGKAEDTYSCLTRVPADLHTASHFSVDN